MGQLKRNLKLKWSPGIGLKVKWLSTNVAKFACEMHNLVGSSALRYERYPAAMVSQLTKPKHYTLIVGRICA